VFDSGASGGVTSTSAPGTAIARSDAVHLIMWGSFRLSRCRPPRALSMQLASHVASSPGGGSPHCSP
jgi:hypothetical protein